jgi:hypothetical protein
MKKPQHDSRERVTSPPSADTLLLAAPSGNGRLVPFLTLRELAEELGVSRTVMTHWVREGRVPVRACFGVRKDGRPLAYLFAVSEVPALARLVGQLRRGR